MVVYPLRKCLYKKNWRFVFVIRDYWSKKPTEKKLWKLKRVFLTIKCNPKKACQKQLIPMGHCDCSLAAGQVVWSGLRSALEMRRPPNLSRGPSKPPTTSPLRRRKTVFVLTKFYSCFFVFINLLAFVAATVPFPDGRIIFISLQWPPLNRIILGQHESDNNNRMILWTDVFCVLFRNIGTSNFWLQ